MSAPQRQWTKAFVGLVLMVGLFVLAYSVFPLKWAIFWTVVGLFEAWTLVNDFAEDTISETIWEWAERPMVPHLFGLAMGGMVFSGFLGDVETAVRVYAIAFLMGHFFFQQHKRAVAAAEDRGAMFGMAMDTSAQRFRESFDKKLAAPEGGAK